MNPPPGEPPLLQFGLRDLFKAMAGVGAILLAAKVTKGSVFSGPLLIINRQPTTDPVAWLITFALVLGMASFPFRPTVVTGFLAFLSALAWLFLGAIGLAMD